MVAEIELLTSEVSRLMTTAQRPALDDERPTRPARASASSAVESHGQSNAEGDLIALAKRSLAYRPAAGPPLPCTNSTRRPVDPESIRRSALFDADWYIEAYPDVAAACRDPWEHYLERGGFEGRDPNPWFDSDWYLAVNPDVADARINPLLHYVANGAHEATRRVATSRQPTT